MSETENAPKRWRDGDDAAGAPRRALLREGSELREWPEARRAQVLRELEQRARGNRTGALRWALGFAVVACAVIALVARPRGESSLPMGALGSVALREHAQVTHVPTEDDPVLRLESGAIDAQIKHRPAGKPFMVETPQLRVVVVGTHFSVRVAENISTVAVQEGRVRVEAHDQSVYVGAGETVRSDDARLQAVAPAPAPVVSIPDAPRLDPSAVSVPECASAAGAERESCVHRVATGSGLAAENALVSQALARRDAGDLASAISSLQTYQSRFPNGLFAPEVAFELVGELAAAGRNEDAVHAGAAATRAFPDDPRAPQVALLCARVLQEQLHQASASIALVQPYSNSRDPKIREEALYRLALAEGDEASWRKYLEAFPAGEHGAEARAHVKP